MIDSVIAKEGQKTVLYSVIAFIIFAIIGCSFLALILFAIAIFLTFVYRVDSHKHTFDKQNIYAPISGKIDTVDTTDSNKIIYINVGIFDYHMLSALETSDVNIDIKKGLNLSIDSFKSQLLNERATIKFENSSMTLLSSICNPSIEFENNTSFEQGEKIGMFLHGQVIIKIDKSFDIKVKIGDKVSSAQTIIATKA